MHSKDYFCVHFLILPLPTVSQVRLDAGGDWLAYVREGTNINLHNIYNGDTVLVEPLSNIGISHATILSAQHNFRERFTPVVASQ